MKYNSSTRTENNTSKADATAVTKNTRISKPATLGDQKATAVTKNTRISKPATQGDPYSAMAVRGQGAESTEHNYNLPA